MVGQNFPKLLLWEESVGRTDIWIVLRVGMNADHADNKCGGSAKVKNLVCSYFWRDLAAFFN